MQGAFGQALGPGLPSWRWKHWRLSWSGPVRNDHQISLWLLSPMMNRLLGILRVALLILLALGLLLSLSFWLSAEAPGITVTMYITRERTAITGRILPSGDLLNGAGLTSQALRLRVSGAVPGSAGQCGRIGRARMGLRYLGAHARC